MIKLVAIFKTSGGKSQTWSLPNPDTNKTPAQFKGLLERIGPLKLFAKDEEDLYSTVETAMIVETTETILF
ncbi:DUF2922 domain-containing protein [Enterococcus hulanensis]|uniref:DUF2922 domain-containing protein n=1 Tax=Enterococcus TaxID=1350 RepID=UPI000B5A7C3A|nr:MULTISPECIES: DUF2922 domain-containing protein [Enterococcus]MBO0413585.1 DUF2922 domain-containing protein [Enterococcus hulanensis]MBO0458512.1 DUF2922 domain-containing protein [Enterococcus hulanensis]MDT2661357.1 DUF2922 domain-containing protein [Enterococcus hulanensis]OTO14300.1 hypothetical protein A5875_003457 [Enterococcus sp. 3H8_DIV0648]